MSTNIFDQQAPTRPAGDNSSNIANTEYADRAAANALAAASATAGTEFSGTKTQTVVAATNVATIILANGAIDGAAGTVTFSVVSDDGTEANVQESRRHYSLVENAGGTVTAAISAAGTQADSSKASTSGTFAPTVATLTATVSGKTVTFIVTTANTTGTQAHATIKVTFRDYTGKTVTIL
jgi:hypothetical protein